MTGSDSDHIEVPVKKSMFAMLRYDVFHYHGDGVFCDPGRLLGVAPLSKSGTPTPPPQALAEGFELLGIKWLPSLSVYHAKELTPHEVGDPLWRRSIQALTSGNHGDVTITRHMGPWI